MRPQHAEVSGSALFGRHVWNRRMLHVLSVLLAAYTARGQAADAADATQRSVAFIDKSGQATELFNAGKSAEALAIFEDLAANYADLDEDGYAALGVGDCLVALGRDDEARAAYGAAVSAHPELGDEVAERLTELELAGDVKDATIERLRQAALVPGENRHAAQWRLGRALQSRARSLLAEAEAAFRSAAEGDLPMDSLLVAHAVLLQELSDDLADLIRRADGEWGSARRPFLKRSCNSEQPAPDKAVIEKFRGEWLVRTKDGRRVEFQGKRDGKDGDFQVSANGKPIKLTRAQQLMIQRHQERINAILLEATKETAEAPPTK